jgi:Tol biopolymer transport system component
MSTITSCGLPILALLCALIPSGRAALAQGGATSLPTTKTVTFTTDEGTWISLDVSPDGRTIVFELLGDIYAMPAAGGPARVLLAGPAFQAQPRFSPDGRRIAYVSDETGSDNVWVANADGTGARALTAMPRAMMTSPAWAPDGSSIYVTVIDNRVAALWRVDIASGKAETLVPNGNVPPSPLVSSPAPGPYGAHASPDGVWLYYAAVTPRAHGVRQGALSRIQRRNLATGRDEPVALDMPVAMRPVLSPDGRLLAYGAQTQGRTGLRIRDLAAETERWLRIPLDRNQLEARSSRDTLPGYAFIPDGAAVVVTWGGRIHRIEVATGKATDVPFSAEVSLAITPAPSLPHRIDQGPVRARLIHQPALAGDGRLAFSALGRLFVSEATGAPRRLTSSATPREFMPAWSPDGQWLAFVTWSSEGGYLWKVSSRGGTPTRLSDRTGFWADPVWTPDGRSVIALRAPVMSGRTSPFPVPDDAQIVSVPASGGAATTIASLGGGRHPHFGPEASRVYVSGPEGLVSYALPDGRRTVHATFPKRMGAFGPQPMEVRLSPDGTRVALAVGDQLYRLALPPLAAPVLDPDATGSVEVSRRAPLGFAFAPDGSLAWITGRTLNTLGVSDAPSPRRPRPRSPPNRAS